MPDGRHEKASQLHGAPFKRIRVFLEKLMDELRVGAELGRFRKLLLFGSDRICRYRLERRELSPAHPVQPRFGRVGRGDRLAMLDVFHPHPGHDRNVENCEGGLVCFRGQMPCIQSQQRGAPTPYGASGSESTTAKQVDKSWHLFRIFARARIAYIQWRSTGKNQRG